MTMNSASNFTPQWDAPRHIRALCSTRQGGTAVIDSITAKEGARAVWLRQVHGTVVQPLDARHTGIDAMGRDMDIEADGAFTTTARLACVVRVADCLPILLCNTQGTWVAALHAGWRGLAGNQGFGVVEQASRAYAATDLIAWLGPCIGKTAFEVGDEVRLAFTAHDPATQRFFSPAENPIHPSIKKWMADLSGLARWRLQAAGVRSDAIFGNNGSRAWCTVSNPDQFFSYRREKECGRMAAAIWIGD